MLGKTLHYANAEKGKHDYIDERLRCIIEKNQNVHKDLTTIHLLTTMYKEKLKTENDL